MTGYAEAQVRLAHRSDGDSFSALWGLFLGALLKDWHTSQEARRRKGVAASTGS